MNPLSFIYKFIKEESDEGNSDENVVRTILNLK